ncbi:MAG: hypothetical protein A2822_03970 [Candidatus Staskawiczbacteria bacterium RIFCSPHIGHO2_01_FULL_41_41]|uniref:N-acetyltransferase domain-containing protein n=1 Tax=Candidatus Staskawiczbacteria bacterium RIFCSPHIGHO2_01_FULL_41_41 TaxID=1802203 RepID=A0A1G2HUK7_9BACT|nr:MAG: hypothetical protein A2822_03970 [Candidatus Staskawiczbacteria bacterium RIFCSPHIGHO2_01_FULL_41_41]
MIRNLEKKDAAAAALLIVQLTKNIVEPEKLAGRIEALVDASNCQWLVAELGGQVAGFGGLTWYAIPSKGLIAWVDELIVDEKFRRQGIAKLLMQELLAIARQNNIRQVKLTSTGGPASSLYESLGFIKKDQEYFIKK